MCMSLIKLKHRIWHNTLNKPKTVYKVMVSRSPKYPDKLESPHRKYVYWLGKEERSKITTGWHDEREELVVLRGLHSFTHREDAEKEMQRVFEDLELNCFVSNKWSWAVVGVYACEIPAWTWYRVGYWTYALNYGRVAHNIASTALVIKEKLASKVVDSHWKERKYGR